MIATADINKAPSIPLSKATLVKSKIENIAVNEIIVSSFIDYREGITKSLSEETAFPTFTEFVPGEVPINPFVKTLTLKLKS